MSWMPVSNAPMQGVSSSLDVQGLSDSFRDGQKLRQEYEARQQQKALNEIMKVGDHNGRLELAQQHKYAGALVPLLQEYDEGRQKAALDNLKTSADIGKIWGETGKIDAETGEVGAKTGKVNAETQGQLIKNTGDTQNQISALAVTRDPKIFALGIGEMNRQGLITPERTEAMIKLITTQPENAAAVMQSMVMANPELAKLFQPKGEVLDGKDGAYLYTNNMFTGEANAPTVKVAYGVSKTDQMQDATSRANNINTNNTSLANNQNTVAGSIQNNRYTVDAGERNNVRTTDATNYGTDSRERVATNAQANDWYVKNAQLGINQQNANTAEFKAQPVVATAGQARKLEANERTELFKIEDGISADKAVISSLNSMLNLADKTNSGFAAAGRARGWSNIGLASEKDDNTVLFDNMATEQALKQLKSTFGAAPTEGERKILMDIQASANKTPAQKKAIINNAIKAANVRLAHRQLLAEGIKTGQYMIPQGTQAKKTPTKTNKTSGNKNTKSTAGASILNKTLGGR